MKRIRLAQETITADNLSYRLDGKIKPRLVNMGAGFVKIGGIPLGQKESFLAEFDDAETWGELEIEFLDDTADNKVVCFYGAEVQDQC